MFYLYWSLYKRTVIYLLLSFQVFIGNHFNPLWFKKIRILKFDSLIFVFLFNSIRLQFNDPYYYNEHVLKPMKPFKNYCITDWQTNRKCQVIKLNRVCSHSVNERKVFTAILPLAKSQESFIHHMRIFTVSVGFTVLCWDVTFIK